MRLAKTMIQRNKFYVGSNSIFLRNWGHETLDEAVEHAQDMLTASDDDLAVVQIVRVVRKDRPTVKVEVVE